MLGPHVGITYGLDLGASGVSIRLNFGELALCPNMFGRMREKSDLTLDMTICVIYLYGS